MQGQTDTDANAPGGVPTMLPRGAENGAVVPASTGLRVAPTFREDDEQRYEKSEHVQRAVRNIHEVNRTELLVGETDEFGVLIGTL